MANGKLSLEEVRNRAVHHAEEAEKFVKGPSLQTALVHATLSQAYATMLVADRAVFSEWQGGAR